MNAQALRPAAFLDRDGVLNADTGYVVRVADFQWLPGAVAACKQLQDAGYALVVVTNQSGVGRGYYSMAEVHALHAHMRTALADANVHLTAVYACPHHPQAKLAAYRMECACRKPEPGMLLQAMAEHSLDASRSLMFGDKASDVQAGQAAGVATCVQVGPGQAFADLAAAVAHVLSSTVVE